MKLEYTAKTDVGRVRDHNEDSFGVYYEGDLFFVCDGMGGHAAGDYASQKVVEIIIGLMRKYPSVDLDQLILKEPVQIPYLGRLLALMVMLANRRLFRLAVMYPKLRGMGTTIASVLFSEGYVNVINVGDSRVYRFRDSELTQLSVDHSWVEEMLEDGEIGEQELGTFREKNVITRALGTGPEVKVDWKASRVKEGDIYLLCSDGLCGEIDDKIIEAIIEKNKMNLDAAANELIDAANDAGGSDNITVVLIRARGEIPYPPSILMNEIVPLGHDENATASFDTYIEKNWPVSGDSVPKGVVREKPNIYKSPYFIAIAAVFIIFSLLFMVKQPWINREAVTSSHKGDILLRTEPPGAAVKLYTGSEMIEEKISPADFLSLSEGEYIIQISKTGFENKSLNVSAVKGKQEVWQVKLHAKAKIQFSLGMEPGFDNDEIIYINNTPYEYYGKPLTVQRIGMVGKIIDIDRGKQYIIRVGNISKRVSVSSLENVVRIKLEKGAILIE